MRRVDAARGAGDAGEERQLVDVGGGAGGIEHAGAQSGGTGRESLAQQLAHPRLFGRRRRAIGIVHGRDPQGRVPDQRDDVDRRPRRIDRRDIGGHRRIDVLVGSAEQVQRRRNVRVHQRRQADAAVADDDGGDALADLRQHVRRRQDDLVVVGMHVDEARRDDPAAGVEHDGTLLRQIRADRDDALALDAHVGAKARRAGAVDDGAAAQQQGGRIRALSG